MQPDHREFSPSVFRPLRCALAVLLMLAAAGPAAGCHRAGLHVGSNAAPAAALADPPQRCALPTAGGGELSVELQVPPFRGWQPLCTELAAFLAVSAHPDAVEIAAARRALLSLGMFSAARCAPIDTATGTGLHCVLEPTTVVRSYHIGGHVPFALFTEDLRRRMSLRAGTVLRSPEQELQAQGRRLEDYLRQEGYVDAAAAVHAKAARGAGAQRGVHLDVAVSARKTVRVRRVEILGELPLPTERLARRFFHRGPLGYVGRFRPLQLADDVEAATHTLREAGYFGARVSAHATHHPEAHAVDLSLSVHAGPRVRLRLEGERVLGERALRRLARFSDEGAVDAAAVEQLRQAVLRAVQEKGYAAARVQTHVGRGIEPRTRVVTVEVDTDGRRRGHLAAVHTVGARRLSAGALWEQAEAVMRPGGYLRRRPFVQAELDHDVSALQAVLRRNGFLQAKVRGTWAFEDANAKNGPGAVAVRYIVDEGPRTQLGDVEVDAGDDERLADRLRDLVFLQPGDAGVDDAIDRQAQQLQLALAQWGYVGAEVQVRRLAVHGAAQDVLPPFSPAGADRAQPLVHPRDARLDVVFAIDAGERAELTGTFVRGNFRTRTASLRQEMGLHPPEPLGIGRLGAAKRGLRATGLFDATELTPVRAPGQNGNTWLVLAVEERDVRSVDGVASFSSDYRFALGADLRDANLFGRAVSVSLSARLSDAAGTVPHLRIGNQDLIEARLRAPHPFGLPLLFEASSRYRYRDVAAFRDYDLSAQIGVSRTFFADRPCALCPSVTTRFAYDIGARYFRGKNDEQPRRNTIIARLRPSIGLDARDSFVDPRRGYNVELTLEGAHPALAGPAGRRSTAFWRLLPGAQAFVPLGVPLRIELTPQRALGGPLVLAVGLSYGAAGPFGRRGGVPTGETFGFGGDADVRGLRNRGSAKLLDYADYVVTGSTELRWYVLEQFGFGSVQLAAFVDGGAVAANLGSLGRRGVLSAGPSLRYVTPVGPLSLAYGYAFLAPNALRQKDGPGAPPRGRFHFTFGYTF